MENWAALLSGVRLHEIKYIAGRTDRGSFSGCAGWGAAVEQRVRRKEDDSKVISWLVAYVLSPCVIIQSFQIDFTADKLGGLGLAVAAAMAAQLLFAVGGRALARPFHLTPIERASVIYSNCGNLIVPLVSFVLGEEWVFYTCAYMMVSTVLTWTHMQSLLGRGKGSGGQKNIIFNLHKFL